MVGFWKIASTKHFLNKLCYSDLMGLMGKHLNA